MANMISLSLLQFVDVQLAAHRSLKSWQHHPASLGGVPTLST